MNCVVKKDFGKVLAKSSRSKKKTVSESIDTLSDNFIVDSSKFAQSIEDISYDDKKEFIITYNKILKDRVNSFITNKPLEELNNPFILGDNVYDFGERDLLNEYFVPYDDRTVDGLSNLSINEGIKESRDQFILDVYNASVQKNIDRTTSVGTPVDIEDAEVISDADLSEKVADNNDDEIINYISELNIKSREGRKNGILDATSFTHIYFDKAQELYAEKFVPFVKLTIGEKIFRRLYPVKGFADVKDMPQDANDVVKLLLSDIGERNGFPADSIDYHKMKNQLAFNLGKEVNIIFAQRKNIGNFNKEELSLYFDYVFVREIETSLTNDASFFIVDIDAGKRIDEATDDEVSFRNVNFRFNNDIINKRTNHDSAKKGDTNAAFIRSLIESTRSLVNFDSISDDKALRLTNLTEHDYEVGKEHDKETVKEFIKRVKDLGNISFIYDDESISISYNQFNALTVDEDFQLHKQNVNQITSFLKRKSETDDVAASIYYSFYNPSDIVIYDPDIQDKAKFKSLSSTVDIIKSYSNNESNELSEILSAFTAGIRSREGRNQVLNTGVTNTSNTADARALAQVTLTQSFAVSTDKNKANVFDSIKQELKGKVKFVRKVEENAIFMVITMKDGNHNKFYEIELKQNEQPDIDTNSLLVYPSRKDNGIFKSMDNSGFAIKDSVGKEILLELGFPQEYIAKIISTINKGIRMEQGQYKPDFTNFVVNYAMMIALNDDTLNISDRIMQDLMLNPVPSKNIVRKRTELKYDIYDYLWKFENAILEYEERNSGVDGDSQFSEGNVRVTKVTTAQNSNINRNIQEVIDTKNIDTFKGINANGEVETNALIDENSKKKILYTAYKGGVYNISQNNNVGNKHLEEGEKLKQVVEMLFLNSVVDTYDNAREANIQSTASEANLIAVDRVFNGRTYDFIPINLKGKNITLDEQPLKAELIKARRINVNAIQDKVLRQYGKYFTIEYTEKGTTDVTKLSPKTKSIIDKFQVIKPEMNTIEVLKVIESISDKIDELSTNGGNINKLYHLDALLRELSLSGKINLEIMNLIDGIIQGSFYDVVGTFKGNSIIGINKQLLYDIDIWNDNMYESPIVYNEEDRMYANEYVNKIMKYHIAYINRATIKSPFTKKSLSKFKLYLEKVGLKDSSNVSIALAHEIVYKAYHYQQMILSVQKDPFMYGDDYKFMAGETVDIQQMTEDKGVDANKINKAYLVSMQNKTKAQGVKFKRVKPNSTGGTGFIVGHGYMPEYEKTFAFDSYESFVSMLGSSTDSLNPTHDGASFILPFALFMRNKSFTGDKYGVKITGSSHKDINMAFDPELGEKYTDKKSTQNIFNYENMSDASYNIVKRLRESVPFSADGKPANVLVPVMIQEIIDNRITFSVDKTQEKVTVGFRNIQELIDYLGDTLNPNILNDTYNVMSDDANLHIEGKYPGVISFADTLKTGARVINPSENLFDNTNNKLFPMDMPVHSMRIILELHKTVDEQHLAALGTQALSASFSGIGSKDNGVEIFKSLGSLYDTSKIELNIDLNFIINKVLYNIDEYTNVESEKNLIEAIYKMSNFMSVDGDTYKTLLSYFNDNRYSDAVRFVLKAYAVDTLRNDLTKKSDSSTLKELLDSNGDLNGHLNSIFQSTLRTNLSKNPLSIKADNLNQAALQKEGFVNVYNDNGKTVMKNVYSENNEVALFSKNEDTGEVTRNITSENLSFDVTKAQQNAEIVFVEDEEEYKRLFSDTNIHIYEGDSAIEMEQVKTTLDPGTKLLVKNIDLAVYSQFAIANDPDNISIINSNKKDFNLDDIIILNSDKDLDNKVDMFIENEILKGNIVNAC